MVTKKRSKPRAAKSPPRSPEIIFAVVESPEGGFEARALGHDIFTQAESFDELKAMVRDAVQCHFDEDDASRPKAILQPI
ncbi:MAG: 2-oxoisovalerate dehydrogenase [Chloroflexi bacterium]|nr:2-oxoisovalerate dehydrogenase [Chloroflexota bacterium]